MIDHLPKVRRPAEKRREKQYIYNLISEFNEDTPTDYLCRLAGISRASYYKWQHRTPTAIELEDATILLRIQEANQKLNSLFGYRKMTMYLNRTYGTNYKPKKIHRIMSVNGIQSVFRRKPHSTWRRSKPEETAENLQNRLFYAEHPNQKWCTDVTEATTPGIHKKAYISTILDLYDRYPVGVIVSQRNDAKLVNDTFFQAVILNQDAHPLFHSDRGFQYTRKVFAIQLNQHGMTQSMSRVGHCIDNGPTESFQGLIKEILRILYPDIKTYDEFVQAIYKTYDFYINEYPQERFHGRTAGEVREAALISDDPKQYPIARNVKIIKYWDSIKTKQQANL